MIFSFKHKNKPYAITLDEDPFPGNCGIDVLHDGEVHEIKIKVDRVFKSIIQGLLYEGNSNRGCFMLSDCAGGYIDTFLFDYILEHHSHNFTLNMYRHKWTFHLSHFYKNPNTENKIRHLYITKERIPRGRRS